MPRTFTGEQRRELARKGMAMPDGGYPIRNVEDLKNAIQAYGRGTNPPAVKKWIKKRAKELDAEDLLPENWEISHSDDELMHYGVKGMKWGVRRYQRKDGSLTGAGKRRNRKAEAKRAELAENAERWSKHYKRSAKDIEERDLPAAKKMRPGEFYKWYDDDELLDLIGGPEGARKMLIKDIEASLARDKEAAQGWMKLHDEIMNAPVEDFYSKDTWKRYRYPAW